jgi:hypothetical protein
MAIFGFSTMRRYFLHNRKIGQGCCYCLASWQPHGIYRNGEVNAKKDD